jgi:chemotaxis protein histidine kinase CheA
LKGLAATLSMKAVTRAAELLEKNLKAADLATVEVDLADLEDALAVVLPGLEQLAPAPAEPQPDIPRPLEEGLPPLEQVLAELNDLLRDNDFEASDRLALLQKLLPGQGAWSDSLAALQVDMDRLDFEAARQSLAGLAHQLSQPSEPA